MFALIFAYIFRFLSISMQSAESGLAKITSEIDWAATMLGLGMIKRLGKVHMPIISGSAIAALLLVFVESVKELPATLIIRPFNFETLATYTYTLASDERLAESANSGLMIVLAGIIPIIFLSKMVNESHCD
jgi:iron(III) transport system permease protein